MNPQEFVEKYKGKVVDHDGVHGGQCVDLARQYMKEVWGFTRQPESVVGAADFFFKHGERPIQRELCDCVSYTGTVQPPHSSLVIFKSTGTNKYGHIGICLGSDHDFISVFEQDGIANDKARERGEPQKGAYIGIWKYDRLIGWLVKKEV